MAETREETSSASAALARMKAAQGQAPTASQHSAGDAPTRPPGSPTGPAETAAGPSDTAGHPPHAAAPAADAPASDAPAADTSLPGGARPHRRLEEPVDFNGLLTVQPDRPPLPSVPPRPPVPPRPTRDPAPRHFARPDSQAPDRLNDWLDRLQNPDLEAWRAKAGAAWAGQRHRWSGWSHAQAERLRAAAEERARRREEARAEAAERRERERQEAAEREERQRHEALAREERERQEATEREERERHEALEQAERERQEAAERGEVERQAAAERAADGSRPATGDAERTDGERADDERAADGSADDGRAPRSPDDIAAIVESAREAIVSRRDRPSTWQEEEEALYVAPYPLPSTEPDPEEIPADRQRRWLVSAAAAVSLPIGLMSLGLFGGGTAHSFAGSPWLPGFSLYSLGTDSFAIWGLLLAGIAAHAVFQWHPTQRSARRQRALGYPIAVAGILSALWVWTARSALVPLSLLIALALLAVAFYGLREANRQTARDRAERLLTDAPLGGLLGWMLVVAPMNLSVLLTQWGWNFLPGAWWATVTILATTWVAVVHSMTERGRIVVALGFAWGMFWLMLPRLIGTTTSALVAILAGLCAFITILATENRRYQIGHAERRAARGQTTEF